MIELRDIQLARGLVAAMDWTGPLDDWDDAAFKQLLQGLEQDPHGMKLWELIDPELLEDVDEFLPPVSSEARIIIHCARTDVDALVRDLIAILVRFPSASVSWQ